MKSRYGLYALWLLLAGILYFFENGTATRAILAASLLLPLLPLSRRVLFSADQRREKDFSSHCEESFSMSPSLLSFTVREEEDLGSTRSYQKGDPLNRIHWKLSAKRDTLLVRDPSRDFVPGWEEKEGGKRPEDSGKERSEKKGEKEGGRKAGSHKEGSHKEGSRRPESGKKETRRKRAGAKALSFYFLSFILLLILSLLALLLIPAAKRSALALCNQVFAASEARNAYAYVYFTEAEGAPLAPALTLLALAFLALLGLLVLTGSRLLALALMGSLFGLQAYLGLPLPGGWNLLLFFLFLCFMASRPLRAKEASTLALLILTVTLAVALVYGGTSARTEAASERARDWLSQMAQGSSEGITESFEGEREARHVHTQTLEQGEKEAGPGRDYHLETIEEEQISLPSWINYLKLISLTLAGLGLLILPFVPFVFFNSIKAKALKAQEAFSSEDKSEAFLAIFQEVISWLEAMGETPGNLSYTAWAGALAGRLPQEYLSQLGDCAILFERAAYSPAPLSEEDRQKALVLLEATRSLALEGAGIKKRLRYAYRYHLWTGGEE